MDRGWKGRLGRKEGGVEESSWVSGLHSRARQLERIRSVGEEHELIFELVEYETYEGRVEQAYPSGRGGTKTV